MNIEYRTITCPHCGLAREVEAARIPEKTVRATCPRCQGTFPLGSEDFSAPQPAATAPVSASAAPTAGFWIRAVASVLDMLALGLVESALASLLIRIGGIEPGWFRPEERAMLFTIASFGVILGYGYRIFFIGYCGQTPGKMAVRVKVVCSDGTEAGYARAFLREVVGKFISKLILGIGYLMVAFDSRKQGLHDRIADTIVIKL